MNRLSCISLIIGLHCVKLTETNVIDPNEVYTLSYSYPTFVWHIIIHKIHKIVFQFHAKQSLNIIYIYKSLFSILTGLYIRIYIYVYYFRG
jgi:hypothetical protein